MAQRKRQNTQKISDLRPRFNTLWDDIAGAMQEIKEAELPLGGVGYGVFPENLALLNKPLTRDDFFFIAREHFTSSLKNYGKDSQARARDYAIWYCLVARDPYYWYDKPHRDKMQAQGEDVYVQDLDYGIDKGLIVGCTIPLGPAYHNPQTGESFAWGGIGISLLKDLQPPKSPHWNSKTEMGRQAFLKDTEAARETFRRAFEPHQERIRQIAQAFHRRAFHEGLLIEMLELSEIAEQGPMPMLKQYPEWLLLLMQLYLHYGDSMTRKVAEQIYNECYRHLGAKSARTFRKTPDELRSLPLFAEDDRDFEAARLLAKRLGVIGPHRTDILFPLHPEIGDIISRSS